MRKQLKNTTNNWGWLLTFGMALTLSVWGGPTYWPLLFSIVGLYMLIFRVNVNSPSNLSFSSKQAVTLLALGAIYYVALRLFFYAYQGVAWNFDPIWPFVLFPFLAIAILRLNIEAKYFWWGAVWAALSACALAIYQHHFLNVGRAYGFANPIPFGNSSVLLAMTCIIGATSIEYIQKSLGKWLFAGAFAAIYTSLLSGSKGGWLALVTVCFLGIYRYWKAQGHLFPRVFWLLLTGLILTFVFLMPAHVLERISHGVQSGLHYFNGGGVTDGSVSIRFELWRFAWNAFLEAPWFGTPWHELRVEMEAAVAQGLYAPLMLQIYTFDNQYIGSLAETGVIGLTGALSLLIAPMLAFWRFRKIANERVQTLLSVALWTVAIFAELGLSASLWGQSMYRQIYVSWLILIWALITAEIRKNNPS